MTEQRNANTVFARVRDPHHQRRDHVGGIARRCGAHLLPTDAAASASELDEEPRQSIILVAVGTEPGAGEPLRFIEEAVGRGFCVLAYEDGVNAWSLPKQCQGLLAGARCVLDARRPDFPQVLERHLTRHVSRLASRFETLTHTTEIMLAHGLVGDSAAMFRVFRWALRSSRLSDLAVLISGETGTGKELLARSIHKLDQRRSRGPFVPVNCGAISPSLAESELFGHRRGAFTGASTSRSGLIRAANGGVLFLDEIGDLELGLQTKLLRVLQEGRVLGVGEDHDRAIDVRVVAATNRDLAGRVARGEFREDLYHRLNVLSIEIPPLRERTEDYEPLIRYFLDQHAASAPDEAIEIQPSFVRALASLRMPGNVRQLQNILFRVIASKSDGSRLAISDLPADVLSEVAGTARRAHRFPSQPLSGADAGKPTRIGDALLELAQERHWNLADCLDQCERYLLESALQTTRGNQARAARILGVSSRTIYNKLNKHGLRGPTH